MIPSDPVVSAVVLSALGMVLTFVAGAIGIIVRLRGLIRGSVDGALKEALGWAEG